MGARIKWTPEMDALLGTMSDQDVADWFSVNQWNARGRRRELGITPFRPHRPHIPPVVWTPEMDALLGTIKDRELAGQLGLPEGRVSDRRNLLRIPHVSEGRWAPEMDALLGTMSDLDLAVKLDLSYDTVFERRKKEGIPAKGAHFKWTAEKEAILYDTTLSIPDVAELLGCTYSQVLHRRDVLSIWDYPGRVDRPRITWPEGIKERLGTVPDKVIAAEVGCSVVAVLGLRWKEGIKSWREQIPKRLRKQRMAKLPDTLTHEQWKFACEWFDDCCAYCGEDAPLEGDHLVPLSAGGPRTALNIIPCCHACNGSKCASKAQNWIYWKFGKEEGSEIITDIVAYLTEVKEREHSQAGS